MSSSKGALPKNYSTPNRKQEKKEEVLKNLHELYGGILPSQIIISVAFNTRYDLQNAITILEDMTNNLHLSSGFTDVPSRKKKSKLRNGPSCSKRGNASDPDVIIDSEVILNHNGTVCSPDRGARKETYLDKVIGRIVEGHRVLILMRGIPGSGKSFLAKEIVAKTVNMDPRLFVFSADDFFQRGGVYIYDPSKIPMAHEWTQQRVNQEMLKGVSPVIIDNTNTQEWEMQPYVHMALNHGYFVEVVESRTPWAFSDKECAKRNSHNVPRARIKDMLERYEKNLTGSGLIAKIRGKYARPPPVPRTYPPIIKRQTFLTLKKSATSVSAGESDFSANGGGGVRDLMNFDDAPLLRPQNLPEKRCTLVDDLLKCDESVNAEVLQAVKNPKTQPSYDGIYPKLDLASWGVNEEEITSWDVVQKLPSVAGTSASAPLPPRQPQKGQTAEIGTITNRSGIEQDPGVRVLVARNRSISEGVRAFGNLAPRMTPMLDKSTMIDDDQISLYRESEEADLNDQFAELLTLFPNVSRENLLDLYTKCNGDINWIGDILLDDPRAELPPLPPPKTPLTPEQTAQPQEESQSVVPPPATAQPQEVEPQNVAEEAAKRLIKNYVAYAEGQQLKKQLEECIDIGAEHYSPHVQQIKNRKHGNKESGSNTSSSVDIPSSASHRRLSSGTDVTDLDDSEFDSDENNQTVELNLGEAFAGQLERKFGDPNLSYPKGFQPVVQIPVSLARQLHALYLESVYQQMDAQKEILESMLKEDEEYAKRLQDKENEMCSIVAGEDSFTLVPPVQDMKELMDQEMAHRLYKQQLSEWKNNLPDNIAYKLTMQKLTGKFPGVGESTLEEILLAHGNNFGAAVEAIKATGIEEKPVKDDFGEGACASKKDPVLPVDDACASKTDSALEELSAQAYRQLATRHVEKRQELYEKAKNALKNGLTPVAQYYIEEAKEQTKLFELANHRAASAFLQQHSLRHNANDTLDLHYLYVPEALSALDIFLDRHISELGTSKKQSAHLMIITGRGKHCEDGRSRLKPAVKKRLKKRSLRFHEMNPGLLRVQVTQHSSLTNNLD